MSFKYLRYSVGESNKTFASHVADKTFDGDEFFFLTVKSKDATLCQAAVMLFIIKAQRGIKFGKLCSPTEISKNRVDGFYLPDIV